jgi:PAS domain S-box-containing protein
MDRFTTSFGFSCTASQVIVNALLKTSQAISSEIVLEKLIETVLRAAVENTGAERSLLIVPQGSHWKIQAEAQTSGNAVLVRMTETPISVRDVPQALVRYVGRTQESVILDDAFADNPFSVDDYMREQRPRSVLCVPLVKQGALIALLYLENRLPGVFTPARLAVMQVLASQAAISLDNSRLYRELEQREAQVRRIVDANIVGIISWDLEGRILEANDAFLNIVGYLREDLTCGRLRWTDLTPSEQLGQELEQLVPELKRTGTLKPFEKEYIHKNGSRVPVLIGIAAFDSECERGVAFVLDLTERKRAEEELRRSRQYLAEAQRLTHTGSYARSPVTGECLYWSEELYRILDFDPAGGLPSIELSLERIHPEDRPMLVETIRKSVEAQADFQVECRVVHRNGSIRNVQALAHPARDAAGVLVEYLGTMIDITEQKRAEDTLRQARDKLAQASKIAAAAELSASVAHEINQPLQAVVANGYACLKWLAATPPNIDRAIRAAESVVRDGRAAADVVGRVRALFRHAAPVKVDVDVNELLLQVCSLMSDDICHNQISLETQLDPDLPVIEADAIQIPQVIVNLLRNAIEAVATTQEGQRKILMRSRREGNSIVIEVRDQGVGISDLEKVFEPFMTTKETGLGMGLAICRSIVEAHAGNIWVARNAAGVTFGFSLPVKHSPSVREASIIRISDGLG